MKLTHCNNPSCGKELIHTEGRRPKKYCSISCRNAHYKTIYSSENKKKEDGGGVKLPNDFVSYKNIGILKEDGTIEKIFKWNGREMILQPLNEFTEFAKQVVQDLSKPNTEIKPVEQPKSNYVIDTQKISELEKELAAIPDTTKGVGKTLGDSIKRRIYFLKYPPKT